MPWPESWSGVDPAAFYHFVVTTRVAPHAFHVWEHTPALWETTPFETRARIVAWQELLRHRLQARFGEWQALLAEFAAAGIPVIALKGFVLSERIYGEPFRRVSCDVDLLVRPEDRERAHTLLEGAGFGRSKWLGTTAASEAEYTRPEAPGHPALMADLHWDVVPRWHFLWQPLDGAWSRAVPGCVETVESAEETAHRRNGETASGQAEFTTEAQRTQSNLQSEHRTSNSDPSPEPPVPIPAAPNPQSEIRNPQSENSQFAIRNSQSIRSLALADAAWFAVVNNVSDYGLANLRGCVEALELLALLDGDGAELFRERAALARAGRTLAALERFRQAFFPGSRGDTVARFAPARRLLFAARFTDERLYSAIRNPQPESFTTETQRTQRESLVSNPQSAIRNPQLEHSALRTQRILPSPFRRFAVSSPQAPMILSLSGRIAVRFALAGPTPRFLRFVIGKMFEGAVWRLKDWKII